MLAYLSPQKLIVGATLFLSVVILFLWIPSGSELGQACCPVARQGDRVVNADQTVIMLWDSENKVQHFVRKATFVASPKDFGFIVPTPTQPLLAESGSDAFPFLQELTKPAIERIQRVDPGLGCGCASQGESKQALPDSVVVLERKTVAGFDASVLAADSATALTEWLERNGYQQSPAIQAWAQPYVEQGWKFTALKIAAVATPSEATAAEVPSKGTVEAPSLRISFKTDRPLFPYREPESSEEARSLGAKRRMLRLFFIAEGRYQGDLEGGSPWSGRPVWSKPMDAASIDKTKKLLAFNEIAMKEEANLDVASNGVANNAGPSKDWWLTEFEDYWPYAKAPSDLYFSKSQDQSEFERPPILEYVNGTSRSTPTVLAIAMVFLLPILRRRSQKPRARTC